MPTKFSLIAFFLLIFSTSATAINGGDSHVNVYADGFIYEDVDSSKSIDDILQLNDDSWSKTEKDNFSVSFSESDYWFKRSFSNVDLLTDQLLLVAEMPLQDYINVWFLDENNNIINHFQSGDRLPFATRKVQNRFFTFPIPQQHLDELKIVMQFSTHDGMYETGPILIEKQSQFHADMQVQYLVYGFLYGGMFILGIYNLFLFVSHRDKQFLLYFLFISSYFFYNLTLRGFSAQYLFPNWPDFTNQFKIITLSSAYFTLYLFVTHVLAIKTNYPRSHLIYTLIVSSIAVPFLVGLGDHYALYYKLVVYPAMLVLLGVIYFSAWGAIRGDRTSKILLTAWVVLATGGILFTLNILGVIEPNLIIFYSIDIGSTIESLIIAFALGDKLNQLRDENDAANVRLIQNQKIYNEEMEQKVEKRTEQLRIARDHAEQSNQKKNTFLANISHEVRTPMHGVLSMLKVIQKTDLSDQQQEYVDMIERSGNRMVVLLNDLLDISHLEERTEPESKPLSLKQLLTDVIDPLEAVARIKNLKLEKFIPEETPMVFGDYQLMEQLLNNLVSNAIKYTNFGSVNVSLLPLTITEGRARVIFVVRDTGVGIPLSLQKYIFDRFYQVDESFSRPQEGVGLGLAICKKIGHLLGGEFQVESTPNIGSQFSFSLDLPIADLTDMGSKVLDAVGFEKKLRFLLVEDEPIGRFAVKNLLQAEGHEVQEALNGLDAIEALEADSTFDVILMDVHMPGMDGLEATRKIRAHDNQQIRASVVIGLTASANSNEKSMYVKTGMNSVVTKPLELSQLGAAIKENFN